MKMTLTKISLLLALLASVNAYAEVETYSAAERADSLKNESGTEISLRDEISPRVTYRYTDVPFKPYVRELFTPSGVNVLLDSPPDHPHHHGLMLAYAADETDFWQETTTPGRQIHKTIQKLAPQHGKAGEALEHRIFWTRPEGNDEVLLEETRKITLLNGSGHKCTLVLWESLLSLPEGKDKVTLTGSHYYGLGMRFIPELNGIGHFLNAAGVEGENVRYSERLVAAAWCAYQVSKESGDVTIAAFAHPENPRFPTVWFTMPESFAYLSATLNLHKEPLVMQSPVCLRYGIAVWDATPDTAEIQKTYEDWLKQTNILLSTTLKTDSQEK